jgi:membrane protein YqaA with SNARE-associated domain
VSPALSLGGLFLSAFLSATLLPGGSEVVLWAVVRQDAALFWPAIAVATAGNTLGGMSSWLIGRLIAVKMPPRGLKWVQDWGILVLLLSWVPVVGDGLCVAAGWMRLNWFRSLLCIAAGKLARYLVIASLA